jgi:hypothetical protein
MCDKHSTYDIIDSTFIRSSSLFIDVIEWTFAWQIGSLYSQVP